MERISPEVIFEEIPPWAFEERYSSLDLSHLETTAIQMYLMYYRIEHIPVDNDYKPPQSFWDDNQYMFKQVETNNSEFCRLLDEHTGYVRRYGFNYLNSVYCDDYFRLHYKEMETTLAKLNREELCNSYRAWKEINDKRENEMVKNIYGYCTEHDFNRGLFLIGAGHRKTIIQKMIKHKNMEEIKINWNYIDYADNEERKLYL
jgi:hypothetical protein